MIKILSRLRAPHLPMPLLFRDKGTRHDQKPLARVSSPENAPRLPCRFVLPRSCLQQLYLCPVRNAPWSMQRLAFVRHRHRSLEHKHASRRNELPAAGVAPCLRLFSGSFDEHAAALLYESSPCLLNGLAHFAANLLARVADAFALVRFRRIKPTDVRRHLSDQFFIGALDRNFCVVRDCDFNVVRNRKRNRMRETKAKV